MTLLLLRIFVKNHADTQSPKVRSAIGSLSGFVGIVCNIILCAAKILVGTLCGSVSITADAMNNLSDATSSVVTLIGFKLSMKPADEDHPYGHARFEYLSGLAVAALIVVIGFELAKSSVEKILHPAAVEFSWVLAGVLVGSMLLKLWLGLFNGKLAKAINSSTLEATAQDSRNDVIATFAVLLAALVEHFTGWQIDGYMGLAVALFILYSGAKLGKETISPLLGEAASPELRQTIVDIVTSEPKVLGYHDLMVHDYGPGQRFASLHVEMDEKESAMECHELIDNLERRCLQENIHLVIHYDPVVTGDERLSYMRGVVSRLLAEQDSRLTLHDFRMVQGSGHTNLIFDVVLPGDLAKKEKQIKRTLDERLAETEPGTYYTVVTFDPAGFNL